MRVSASLVVALSTLAVAQEQNPLNDIGDKLKGWFEKVQSYVPAAPSAPVDAGAAKVAEVKTVPLTLENWRETLTPSASAMSEGPEEWMVYITGGNKTCYGMCGEADKAWNESVALLSAQLHPPHLGSINCDEQPVLCNSWAAGNPSIYHILLPAPVEDQSKPATTIRIFGLNRTSVSPTEIAKIHTSYEETEPYEGVFHPFDGVLAQNGLAVPLGYFLWAFALIPSWAFMLGISFFSRTIMGRRQAPNARAGGAAPAGATPGDAR